MKALSHSMHLALNAARGRRWGTISDAGWHVGTLKALERRGLLELHRKTTYQRQLRSGRTEHITTRHYHLTEAGWKA